MSDKSDIVAHRMLIQGAAAELELTALVKQYRNQFTSILNAAAELSEEDTQAAYMGLTLAGLDMAEGLL